ncbi:unnamed protein product [Fusarium langsethiae]|nr:unnamed protein product [Fusarium langsethiae]
METDTTDFATSLPDIERVPSILAKLKAGYEDLVTGGREGRRKLWLLAQELQHAVSTAREMMTKHCLSEPAVLAVLVFGVETGLWKLMARNGDKPQPVEELAVGINVDPELLSRLMRHLGATGYLIETRSDEYLPTSFIKAMSLDQIGGGYPASLACLSRGTIGFSKFARERGFKNPCNDRDTSLMMAYHTDQNVFSLIKSKGYLASFNHLMGGYGQGRLPWTSFYPVEERLVVGADPSPVAPFLVDIGGNIGHDLERFQKKYPKTPGLLFLQDLEPVISGIKGLNPKIIASIHDFHTPQPITGARAYFMHSCLHNWPDEVCRNILMRITEAMQPGYSKLLINEIVIPPTNGHWEQTSSDITMMALLSSKERTERAWRCLVESIPRLSIQKIWHGGVGNESLIECERV